MDELSGRRPSSPPPPPPPLPTFPLPQDDILLEILLRLPSEPIHLLRASIVCKHWRGLVRDARFLRRFRAFHRTAPVLGFFLNHPSYPLFVPTSDSFAVSSEMSTSSWWAIDCRHGRVLLDSTSPREHLVWDLMTGDKRYLPPPPAYGGGLFHNATVLCAAGHDDHGDCHSCPFLVAFVYADSDYSICACVYSSEAGVWGEVTSVTLPGLYVNEGKPTALVGNALYWLCHDNHILEFDLDKSSLDIIELPHDAFSSYNGQIVVMPAEDGGLGFAGVEEFSLLLWSRVPKNDGVMRWTLSRVIDLEKLLPLEVVMRCMLIYPTLRAIGLAEGADVVYPTLRAIGFAEGADVIFIYLDCTIYMIHLKSMRLEKALETESYHSIYPYTSFYTAGVSIGGGDDQAEVLNYMSD